MDDLHSVRHDHHEEGHATVDDPEGIYEDLNRCYAMIDELLDQLFTAGSELRIHKFREHEDIRQVLDDIAAVYRTQRLIRDLVDPREVEDD